MKNYIQRILVIIIITSTVSISDALPNSNADNDISLLLDGKVTESGKFIYVTNGRLTLVDLNSKSRPKTEFPFFAYLKRDGKIVDGDSYARNFSVRSIELTEILKTARVGDDIVIEPANKSDISGKKILYLKYSQLFPAFNWFSFLTKNKGGC